MLKRVGAIIAAVLLAVAGSMSGQNASAAADTDAASARAPRFLLAAAGQPSGHIEVAPDTIPVMQRRVSFSVKQASIADVLTEIGRRLNVMFSYDPALGGLGRRLTLRVDDLTLAAVLTKVLFETGLDVLVADQRHLALVPRAHTRGHTGRGGTVMGRVTDANTGTPLANADIFLESTEWRATTDTAGRYRLVGVDNGTYTLIARRLGYAKYSRRITIGGEQEDTVDMALAPVAARLDELITTATGRRRRLDVPNDITTINADSVMRAAPVHSVTDLLEHRVPGLTVQRTSGVPGDPARLRLRGAASPLQNNDPIVVVDGVRVYAEQSAARSANLANPTGSKPFAAPSPLDYIDPTSIETIDVVKGPSAATLYGPDAANGVIVITTKKGKAGPTRWTLNAGHGRTQMAGRYPNLLLRWGHTLYDPTSVLCPISGSTFNTREPCVGDSVVTFQMLNDPALTILDRGHDSDLHLGVSGGTQALTYAVRGSYGEQLGLVKLPEYEAVRYQALEGTSPPDWMRRPERLTQWNATTQFSARLGTRAEVSLTTSLSRTMQQRSTLEQQLSSLMSTFLDRGSGLYYSSQLSGDLHSDSSYAIGYRQRATAAATQFTNRANASWRPQGWLTLTADAGLDVQQRADEVFMPRSRDSLFSAGLLNLGTGASLLSTVNAGAVAIAPLGHGLHVRFATGINYVGHSIDDAIIATTSVPYGTSLIGTQAGSPRRNVQNDATFGWYLAPSIAHSRFSIDLGLRLDGGSAYGSKISGFKLPTFPKLGFSYLLSDEPWFPLKSLFQAFRVRTAYGRAGRQPGPADRLRLYSTFQPALGDGGDVTMVTLQTLGNTELRPERTAELEGGFDADLLDGRLAVILTGFRKTTEDALLAVPVPPSVYGNNVSMLRNIGVVRNTGLELSADAQLVRTAALTWSMRLTLSSTHGRVVRLAPGVQAFYTEGNDFVGGTRVAAGYPLFGRWSKPVLGYADANGNRVLERTEVLYGDTAVYVGRQEPDYTLTVAPSLSLWHGALTVTAGLAHVGGQTQRNEVAGFLRRFSHGTNDPSASLAEQLATGFVNYDGEIPTTLSDFTQIQTIATSRFDDLSVRYTLPTGVARRVGAQRLSLAVQGRNLGLWTNYRGLDPDVNAFATGNSVTDTGVLPMPRVWQVRLDVDY